MAAREIIVEAPELRLDPEAILERVDWNEVFGQADSAGRIEVEIGIGKGRFLLAAAEKRPDVLHLGVEWANKYLRIAESRAARKKLTNIRFARVDARELLRVIPDASVNVYYAFYPDPWPKKRHLKRRLLQPDNLEQFLRTLVPGGMIHVATDHNPYWSEIEPLLDGHPALERQPEFGGQHFPLPVDGPLTNFEAKYEIDGRDRNRGSWRKRDVSG